MESHMLKLGIVLLVIIGFHSTYSHKILRLKDVEPKELSNNMVSIENVIPSVDFKPNSLWIPKPQRKCCKRGQKAARKGMNCGNNNIMESGLLLLRDLKFNIQLHKEDASFTQKVMKCFLKPDTAQYFTRCCKEVRMVPKN